VKKDKNRSLKDECKKYIKRTTSFPEAQILAKKDGFSANASVWFSAMAELMSEGYRPGQPAL